MSTVTYGEIQRGIRPDADHDTDNAVGVTAYADIYIPYGDDAVTVRVESPGLWGIEIVGTKEDAMYLAEVFVEQREVLVAMLDALGAKPLPSSLTDDRPPFGSDPSGFTRV